ncbi:unnamed protein product [Leuciscus chuanchicus]
MFQAMFQCVSSEFVPYGNETGWLAVYSSRGPSVRDATVAALIDRVQIGKPLLMEVSDVTITNSIYTHSTSWQIRACPSGTEYLNLMLSERGRDIPSCAPLPTDTEDKQQDKASTKPTDSHKRGFPAACRIRAVSRSDEGPSPGPDDNAVLKCQLVCPYGGSLYHSTDKALSGKFVSRSYP